jgi:hypothetical protein
MAQQSYTYLCSSVCLSVLLLVQVNLYEDNIIGITRNKTKKYYWIKGYFIRQMCYLNQYNIRQKGFIYKDNVSFFIRQKGHWQVK